MPPTAPTTLLPTRLFTQARGHPTPGEACLEELAKVRRTLALLHTAEKLHQQQIRSLLRYAQDILGILEASSQDNQFLVHAQVILLEALALARTHQHAKARRIAFHCLRWFLETAQE
ncbi:hypothetical protein [Rufibacter latericius]|uniref:Uncharacterized protein n=1 Tax=Rufibacter latericius TaxID=2487040 RepID=A0A3M9MF74_9BACT|nr:hypothetical protein [Rufibacter latericius]RNI24154.1 hypothetical protein EFB08_17430 [Rufibacter latericius]